MRCFLGVMMVAGLLAYGPAQAVSLSDTVSMELSEIQTLIEEGEHEKAIDELWRYVEAKPDSADAYNLLGYSYRKDQQFDRAKQSYDRALQLDSEHKGAHEYLGELYLQTGKPELAEAQLEKLAEICGLEGCDEYEELRVAIGEFKRGKSTGKW